MNHEIEDLTDSVIGRTRLVLSGPDDEILSMELIKTANDKVYLNLRPLVQSLGLEWAGQRKKILRRPNKYDRVIIASIGQDDKRRKMLCINRATLWMFLDSIHERRLSDSRAIERLDSFRENYLPFIMDQTEFEADDHDLHSHRSPFTLKGEPKIKDPGLIELQYHLVKREEIKDIHQLIEFAGVRFARSKNESRWYAAKDLCHFLKLKKYRSVLSRVSEDNKKHVFLPTPGGLQMMSAINIEGLKEIITTSRKPGYWRFFHKYIDI